MSTPRVLVVDAQALQTPAWHRGIGKYSIALLTALVHHAGPAGLDLHLVVSEHLADAARVDELRALLPSATIAVLDLRWSERVSGETAHHNRRVVDTYLAGVPRPATGAPTFLTLCQMVDQTVCVVPGDVGWRRAVVVYDLIPFLFHRLYLRTSVARTRYLSRLAEMTRADEFLAISRTVADDLALHLGIDHSRIDVLTGGPIVHRRPDDAGAPVADEPPFLLMPSGNDLRKNNRLAVLGFARFNARHDNAYRLRITSTFEPHERDDLVTLAPGVEFTGNVDGPTMDRLYRDATALLFAPEYEGLGLPVLEAVAAGRPVACSDIAVFRELSTDAFDTFEPHSISGIADALDRAVVRVPDAAAYAAMAARYTWERTAAELADVLDRPHTPAPVRRARLLVVGPDPAGHGLAGATAQLLHAELTRHADVRYLVPDPDPLAPDAAPRADLLGYADPTAADDPDHGDPAVVVHLDDDPRPLPYALAAGGTVVLYRADLTPTWDAAVAAGLVHPSRLALEQRLDEAVDGGGTLLAGVVARADRVLTVDAAVHAAVTRVAARLPHPPPVTPWPLPAGVARHTGGRDARRVAVARSSPPPPSLTDHQRDDARRAVACLVTTAAPADDADVLAAARLGVVPVDTADSGAALAADAMAWEAASTRMREQVADRHRPAQAAASLATPHG